MDSIRKLATQSILGRLFPSLKFFEPTSKFLRWMKREYPNEIIYDVGAGVGHVAKALSEKGLKVIALDLNYRESTETFPVIPADGESYDYEPNSVVMICRPCHGQFTEQVIVQAMRCKASAVLYVGLDRNVEGDLGMYQDRFKASLAGAGHEGERVWVMAEKG